MVFCHRRLKSRQSLVVTVEVTPRRNVGRRHGNGMAQEPSVNRSYYIELIIISSRKKLTNFNIAKGSDSVGKFLEIEDVFEEMRDAEMDIDDQTVYGIYVAALPSEYDLEIRELSRKQVFDRGYHERSAGAV